MAFYSSNVDNVLDFLGTNYQLFVAIITMVVLFINMLKSSIDTKKSLKELSLISKENKTNSKVLFENQVESVKEVGNLMKEVVNLLDLGKETLDEFNELKKMFILLLQVANIPIHSKEAFLSALDEKGVKGIDDAVNGLKTQINNQIKQDNNNQEQLNKEIDELDRL